MRLLLLPKHSYLVKDTSKKFHVSQGYITPQQLQAPNGTKIVTSTGVQGHILDANFADHYAHIKRKAQIMLPKDIGWIVSATGLDKAQTVVDAGSGSGGAAVMLSRFAKRVYSYDVRQDHLDMAQKNAAEFNATNVEFILGDVKDNTKQAHVMLLDIANTHETLPVVAPKVHPGGYIVTYTPSITQAQQVIQALPEKFIHITTVEIIEREWVVDEKRCRPAHGALGHTAFLTLLRRVEQ